MTVKKQNIIYSFFILICFAQIQLGFSQQRTKHGTLNRFIPYSISDSINSSYDELNPVLSIDGNTLFFTRSNHPENHYGDYRSQDIWYSTKDDEGHWSKAKRVQASFNNNRFNAIYAALEDGGYLISGVYTKKGRYKRRGLSIVDYKDGKWSRPEKLKVRGLKKQNEGLTFSAGISDDGGLLILAYSKKWQKDENDHLRYSTKKRNGKWKKPKKIKNKVLDREFGSIDAPFVAADGKTIYFSAFRDRNAQYYQNDIYKITHRGGKLKKNWSSPKKLDNVVNTEEWESYYKLFNDENWAMYCSASIGGDSDILIVKLIEPRPYVDLKGLVTLNEEVYKAPFKVMINDQIIDSVNVDALNGSYAVQLPLGKRYELKAIADNKVAKTLVVDASHELEYLPMERNLEIALVPFLDLSGSVTVDGRMLTDPFEVLVNGQKVDSMKINQLRGTYSVKLPLGETYRLSVKSGNYIPIPEIIDVSNEKQQVKVFKDLKMKAIPYVDISGQVLNQESGKVLNPSTQPKIMVDGVVVDSVGIVNGNYSLRLPWGKKYLVQVQANEFAPEVAVIDLFNVNNYEQRSLNLYAAPLQKYATITGKVLNKKTGMLIKQPFTIDVDGTASTNSTVNPSEGTYSVKIPLGGKVTLTARADSYFPISEVIDVTQETENVKILKDLQLVPLEVGESILLNNIFFETASTKLKPESFTDIDRVADLMRAVPTLKIEISGYTDSSGKDSYNMALSKSRAESVANYIIGLGIDEDRVNSKGYGESKPVGSNLTPEGRAKNRRVEFIILEK
ncbi:OmpA family protein [Marivirga sp.]|uniref:OmpA family protein n=1 Tax=Marivirga sp. TaxID=2018662 RepID=UPI0025D9380B|nr:OmpA family protein [Marivirga sp.]